jgi:hypothetical protein
MPLSYKICSPFVPGLTTKDDGASNDEAAVLERVDNVRVTPIRSLPRTRAAFERLKLWQNGRTLRVKFLDGIASVQEKVRNIAREWEDHANLKLEFVTSGTSEIRISFAEKDFSWSAMGTDSLSVPADEPTMNYGWLEPDTEIREYQRVVRHEFGHALGMIHEHQNPAAQGQIPWDKPKVYAYYAQQGWSKADVDFNIFSVYSEDSTNHSAFDPTSIMEYAVPDSLTIGSYAIGWNTEFSATDREYMRKQYPKNAPAVAELDIGGARVAADIAASGEVDTYHFNVAGAATYIMTTEGTTDTVLTLHGPGDAAAVITWDDDRGRGANARIVRKLQPGDYWLTARHKASGTGQYSVGIKKRA